MNNKALEDIIEVFEKWNVDIQLVFVNGKPQIDFCYEDENEVSHEIDGFWEERIKAYSLRRYLHDTNTLDHKLN